MAANYWNSTHHKLCSFTRDQISSSKARLYDLRWINERELLSLDIFFATYIKDVAKRVALRQRVVATAIVFFKRFFLQNSFASFDPWLVAPTCLYLASKVEECTIQAKKFENKLNSGHYTYSPDHILDMEFTVMQNLSGHLIVFHPYRDLQSILEDMSDGRHFPEDLAQLAWAIVNDSYCSDAILMHAPYEIAIAAIFIAGFVRNIDLIPWLTRLRVDLKPIWQVVEMIMSMYEVGSLQIQPTGIVLKFPQLAYHDKLVSVTADKKKR
ncbi:Cyclin family protein [Pelomyxa schiedti]|nr:Cyclin family protein [Pelomyxa schiedti]